MNCNIREEIAPKDLGRGQDTMAAIAMLFSEVVVENLMPFRVSA